MNNLQNNDAEVIHPSHYNSGAIETIDYIKEVLTPEEFIGFCLGNVIKYLSRYRLKGGKKDLEKALVYLTWAIESFDDNQ